MLKDMMLPIHLVTLACLACCVHSRANVNYYYLNSAPKNTTVCQDDKERCGFYWSRGWYTCGVGAVLYDYCKKSCGYCEKDPIPTVRPGELCKDFEPQCPKWAKYKECIYARKFTQKYCPKSCGLCPKDRKKVKKPIFRCIDKSPLCALKARYKSCLLQRPYMSANCRKSCKMCSQDGSCFDTDSLCNWWKKKNYCKMEKYREYMRKKCQFSCAFCNA
ncbi:nematocyst expressed protein 3-like [Hydractinia symbiolongicarpus]|uniref:nematocyst expressed protein 3-like n=1 Tax=Hydractinia symbiolongicarpus TaxID=13093 RepID=UPI00254E9E58|nr:nematocyst expressed protein 3-like [Hydractinia symbiolongicarpus]